MEIISKKNYKKEHLSITKNKIYEAKNHSRDMGWITIEYVEFFDDNNKRKILHPKDLYKFFYTKQECRIFKLEKLNKNE